MNGTAIVIQYMSAAIQSEVLLSSRTCRMITTLPKTCHVLAAASQPSRHLLLGNIATRPNESAIETVFGKFGPLEAVKVFPGKTYALVSFKELPPAAEAMQCLDGHSLLSVSGGSDTR